MLISGIAIRLRSVTTPVTSATHQTDTPAHHDTVTPAQDRLRIGVNQIIESIFPQEERCGIFITERIIASRRGMVFEHGLVESMQIATGAESFLACSLQHHQHDPLVTGPKVQSLSKQIDHLEIERVERLRRVKGCHTDHAAAVGRNFLKQHQCGGRLKA